MATPISTILQWFTTGKKPSQAQFWASWQSFWHKDEQIPQSSVNGLPGALIGKADKIQLDGHIADANAHGIADKLATKSDVGHTHMIPKF
ncbi:hypothetical protein [Flavobacterium kingsejongi]|uniref:Uncharacterized protein n=1 Tax=Flavobacterium kingsejongi TaxID=1678728 RepID=A0A2S1LTI1_9FLAO|nr:hypothetical protein [Flavobacterium kingsejongi]AWG26982.1 hypothetical protein FK004_17950 [Flavobacterium kingsejongi]